MLDVRQAIAENYIWIGTFPHHQLADEFAQSHNLTLENTHQGFNSEKWHSRQIEMLESAETGCWPRKTTILNYLSIHEPTQLIDLGGGSGWLWAGLLKSYAPTEWEYLNIELDTTREAFESHTSHLNGLSWHTDSKAYLPKIKTKNILYSNSCLQYLENNDFLLELVKSFSPKNIILDDVIGQADDEFYSLQNYYGFLQVNRFVSLSKLSRQIKELGYSETYRNVYEVEYSKKMKPKIFVNNNLEDLRPQNWTLHFEKNH